MNSTVEDNELQYRYISVHYTNKDARFIAQKNWLY